MHFDVISLFPEMVMQAASYGVTGKAIEKKIVSLSAWNPRDYTTDKHRTVDAKPYGGGPGMVMKYQPLADAVKNAKSSQDCKNKKVVYLSPQGKVINQHLLSTIKHDTDQLILIAGRYEGVDERFIETICDEEWSLGDYVISGGELGALIVIDAVTRLLPDVLGDEDSAKQDSYSDGLLEFPHYTRPEKLDQGNVPEILLSGNHAKIERWRTKQALGRTWKKRSDLLEHKKLTAIEHGLLEEFKLEVQ
ncbi:MAG: tRNA (guanosine(37)-N1)-methyltransferase TrmD [Methylococcales bacterium]|nr:tRNA (guanosine(37)-N1)-methyltransferase TrmD [Methylococcales bacterium]MCK5924326.1 tRNA (guanosine(37)-N1)-methyltransferase TrmD [Methylococcales bacterium]